MTEDFTTILNEVYAHYDVRYGNAIVDVKNEMLKLKEENKILKENAEHNDKVVDQTNWENKILKNRNEEMKKKLRELSSMIPGEKTELKTKVHEILLIAHRLNYGAGYRLEKVIAEIKEGEE